MRPEKKRISEVGDALQGLFAVPAPSIGLDIDGCITEFPIFFRILSAVWPGKVFVVSYRSDRDKTEAELKARGIRYDELVLVGSLEAKAAVIKQHGILVFFDDQPECLKHVDSMRNVLLVRNGGNFDFEDKRWTFSEETGKMV